MVKFKENKENRNINIQGNQINKTTKEVKRLLKLKKQRRKAFLKRKETLKFFFEEDKDNVLPRKVIKFRSSRYLRSWKFNLFFDKKLTFLRDNHREVKSQVG